MNTLEGQVVVIVGSGLVGRAWAVLFARSGLHVRLFDTLHVQLSAALQDIRSKLQQLEAENMLARGGVTEDRIPIDVICSRISTYTALHEALKGDILYVQECVPEVLEIKQQAFSELERCLDACANAKDVILASSTSNMPVSQFCASLKHREQCIVAHPINPPHLIPLVEIVAAPFTSPLIVAQTKQLMQLIGQKPVVVQKEVPGFALNRLQFALLTEAFSLVEDGVLSPEDVDTVVTHGLAMRWNFMGPFQTIDLNAPKGVQDYCERYLQGIYDVTATQNSQRRISPATVQAVNAAMRAKYSVEQIPEATQWRNQRLADFVKCRAAAEDALDSAFPKCPSHTEHPRSS